MARIVVVLSDPPLPFGNAAARWSYVLVRGLVGRGHRVVTLSAVDRPEDAEETRRLFPSPEYDLRLFPRSRARGLRSKWGTLREPYGYLYGPELREELRRELADGFDVLHLEHLWGGWLGREYAGRALIHVHYLFRIDLRDRPARTLGERLLRLATRRAETALLRSYPTITTLSPRLTAEVRRISPGSDVRTVPLGIDPSLYEFAPPPPTRDGPVVSLIGTMNWHPTASAAERLLTRLWPEILRRVPEARLRIVGRKARATLAGMELGPRVEVAEDVPDTIPYFRETDALVYAPGPASGMKVKVMEAFALGTPVVTNAEGVEGLPAEDGVHAGIAEDDAGLIDRAVALLEDPALRGRYRAAARALLETHCGPGPVLDRLERVYEVILRRPADAPRGRVGRSGRRLGGESNRG